MPAIMKKTTARRNGFSKSVLKVATLNDETPPPSSMKEVRAMYVKNQSEIKKVYDTLQKATKFSAPIRNMLTNEYMRAQELIDMCSQMRNEMKSATGDSV